MLGSKQCHCCIVHLQTLQQLRLVAVKNDTYISLTTWMANIVATFMALQVMVDSAVLANFLYTLTVLRELITH